MTCFVHRIACALIASVIRLFLINAVHAAEVDTLRPVDTSSPRATLHGFVTLVSHRVDRSQNRLLGF
jgi:hypothetical protein